MCQPAARNTASSSAIRFHLQQRSKKKEGGVEVAMLLRIVVIIAGVISGCAYVTAATPQEFGGKGDVVTVHDGTIDGGSLSFRSASAVFTSKDVGKAIVVSGAGAGGNALVTKIQAFVAAKQVTLAASASTSVTEALTYYGSDDTSAIRSCIYQGIAASGSCTISDGVTFMVSNSKSTIATFAAGHNPVSKFTLDGHGTIIFAPQEPLTAGTNDRFFYISSQETNPMPISGPIDRGASSFTAQNVSDASLLSPGDWVVITERDSAPMARDNVYADWAQVSEVMNAAVKTTTPFRTAFPNKRPWAGPPRYWGLGFRKVAPLTSNVTVRDITIIVPKVKDSHVAVAIATRDTRGTVISNVKCQDASGNCFAGYMDQGLKFQNNEVNGALYPEFASEVDADITGNRVNEVGTALSLLTPATSGGLEIDFGTAFSNVTDNSMGPVRQVCILVSPGVHDTVVKGNICDLVTFGSAASCILSRGGYRMTVTQNTCKGATGKSTAIDVGDANGLTVPMYSDSNRIFDNSVRGFSRASACGGGRLRTDMCRER